MIIRGMRKKIGIAYGHGGVLHDRGASGKIIEYVVNKEVVDNIIKLIKKDNLIDVVLCNVKKEFSHKNQTEDMSYKCNVANKNKVDLFVEVHHNSGGGHGAEVFAISTKGTKLAREVLNELVNDMGLIDRGVKNKGFYVLRNTNAPACLVEGWFVDSLKDYEKYQKFGAEIEAKAILKGIYDYLGIKKPSKPVTRKYKVKKGQTLYGIARELGVTVDYLCEKNNLQNKNLIAIGEELIY